MTLKKKLAVSTLAVSMAAASVAGFPFSSKGLAQNLGVVGTASAASDNTNIQAMLKYRLATLYSAITVPSEKQVISNFRTQLLKLDQADFEEAFKGVLPKLSFLEEGDTGLLFELFNNLVDNYLNPDLTSSALIDFNAISSSEHYEDYKAVIKRIGTAVGVPNLTIEQLYITVIDAENAVSPLLKDQGYINVAAGLQDRQSNLYAAVKAKVLATPVADTDLTIKDVFDELNTYGVTLENVLDAKTKLESNDKIEKATRVAATAVIGQAYYNTYLATPVTPPFPGGGIPGGSTTDSDSTTNNTPTGTLNVASLVSVTDGKATLKLVDASVLNTFDALVAANAGKTDLTVSLDLGTVTAATVEAPISQAIIEVAKAKGIANIAIAVNGLTVNIPVGQFGAAVSLSITTAADSSVTSITSLKLASKVYDFGLTVGGVATTTFKQPLTIKLPLNEVSGLDKELLSVAKIVDGKLQFQGGVVDGNYIVEPRDTFSSYATVENKVTFSDIANVQAWAGRQIQVVAAKGAIEGVGEGKFAPKSNVTRAEFAKMLIRALNLENSTAKQNFGDVSASAWYAPYVAVAAEKGIITGRNASTFDPNATITRAEMAAMIARAVKGINPSATTDASALNKFADAAKISSSLKDGVAFAASNNLVIGSAGKFNPNNTATRAEAAVIIYRTINFK